MTHSEQVLTNSSFRVPLNIKYVRMCSKCEKYYSLSSVKKLFIWLLFMEWICWIHSVFHFPRIIQTIHSLDRRQGEIWLYDYKDIVLYCYIPRFMSRVYSITISYVFIGMWNTHFIKQILFRVQSLIFRNFHYKKLNWGNPEGSLACRQFRSALLPGAEEMEAVLPSVKICQQRKSEWTSLHVNTKQSSTSMWSIVNKFRRNMPQYFFA